MVNDFRSLVCWQLSYALKCDVFAITATGDAARDFKYRDQVRDSTASAPRNIAEGFGRYTPKEFARFLGYARASLIETQNHLIDGLDRGYFDEPLYKRLSNLTTAALRTTTSLMRAKQRQVPSERERKKSPARSTKP
jgi:four helix bundle protein